MEAEGIPDETLEVFARSIHEEARRYGFSQVDMVRLINALMDSAIADQDSIASPAPSQIAQTEYGDFVVESFPLRSSRLEIRLAEATRDEKLLSDWMNDNYGNHFLLSSDSPQRADISSIMKNPDNQRGILMREQSPIGAVAFLDIDKAQRRAELRKIIGVREARGKGYAEEATRLWIEYGGSQLGLEKIYVSTLQTHLRNIQLNESIGFRVEGLLHNEVVISGARYDVLRMGLCYDGDSR